MGVDKKDAALLPRCMPNSQLWGRALQMLDGLFVDPDVLMYLWINERDIGSTTSMSSSDM
jgi:hypothetical protein